MTVDLVAGTRPNFMKIAPVRRALVARKIPVRLIHTGQHFDAGMSDVFFRDLGMPAPDVNLGCGGGSHAEQTASVLVAMERELLVHRPEAIVVVGDVTSTLSAGLAAAKLGVPVVHVEAGLRSRDWTMPEEINRILTDQLSDLLLVPSDDGRENLIAEGIPAERIAFVGNVMIDSLHHALERRTDVLERLGLQPGGYCAVTMHRPANVDSRESFQATLAVLRALGSRIPTVFPVHPRTAARAEAFGLAEELRAVPGLVQTGPVGYDDFVTLMGSSKFVATDSGGIQEETTALQIPCLTLRGGTERPITVSLGTNTIVGLDVAKILAEVDAILAGRAKRGSLPEGWDGHAGERVAEAIARLLEGTPPPRTAGPRA